MSGRVCWRWLKTQIILFLVGVIMASILYILATEIGGATQRQNYRLQPGLQIRVPESGTLLLPQAVNHTFATPAAPDKPVTVTVWDELNGRRQQVEEACSESSTPHSRRVNGVFLNADTKLAYCFVPKTGCTFWKQVFAFLNNDTGLKTNLTSPFDIPRLHVHLYAHANGMRWTKVQKTVGDYRRFMFARDPYTRLWSAYIDKFWLPDFWSLFGHRVLMTRSPRLTKEELACGMGVTFPEFVKFAMRYPEPHWMPVSKVCDPCLFKPHVVGKMETYTRDARAILGQADLDWILDGVDHKQHVRNELDMLIDYNFQVIHKKSPKLARGCIKDQELGARLWTAFQYNGYIADNLTFTPTLPVNNATFKSQVMDAFEKSALNVSLGLKQQKTRHMEEAFRQLPKELLTYLAKIYAVDFKMFGYSSRNFS